MAHHGGRVDRITNRIREVTERLRRLTVALLELLNRVDQTIIVRLSGETHRQAAEATRRPLREVAHLPTPINQRDRAPRGLRHLQRGRPPHGLLT